jgi:drug/metabolite transporter (DMT)-like permease
MGILLALLSATLGASKDLVSKHLTVSLDPTTSTFASFFFALPFYVVALLCCTLTGHISFEVGASFWTLVLLRTLSDAAAEWSKLKSLSLGDISFVAPIISLTPLFLLIIAPLITGDATSFHGIIAVVLSVLGSLLLFTERQSGKPKIKAVMFALITAFFFALNSSFDRLTVQSAHPLVAGATMTALAALLFLPPILYGAAKRAALKNSLTPLLIRGLLETGFMTIKLGALFYLAPQYVSAIGRLSLLCTVIGGHVIYKEGYFWRRMSASALIIAGVVMIIAENYDR